jgi:hypothetical protein
MDINKFNLTKKEIKTYTKNLQTRTFYVSEIGGFKTRKEICVLINEFKIVDVPLPNGNGWRVFSLDEALRIKFIQKLREYKVSFKEIDKIKKLLSDFNSVLILSLINDLDIVFYYSNSRFNFILQSDLGTDEFPYKNEPYLVINMKRLYFDFFKNKRIEQDLDYFLGICNPSERMVLNYMKEGNFNTIVFLTDNLYTGIIDKTNNDWDKVVSEFACVIKQGTLKSISFHDNYEGGEVVTFDMKNQNIW